MAEETRRQPNSTQSAQARRKASSVQKGTRNIDATPSRRDFFEENKGENLPVGIAAARVATTVRHGENDSFPKEVFVKRSGMMRENHLGRRKRKSEGEGVGVEGFLENLQEQKKSRQGRRQEAKKKVFPRLGLGVTCAVSTFAGPHRLRSIAR